MQQWYKLPEHIRGDKNESELWVDIYKSRISLKGADNEDSLRGSGLWGIILDEVAFYKSFDTLWDEALRPALTDNKGFAWFVGTPKGYNHFYDLYLKEQKDNEFQSFHFTSYENPYIAKEEIDKQKEELTEDAFGQEFLAEFKKYTGLIYKEFSRDVHVIDFFKIPEGWSRYGAMDFGARNPTVFLWIALDRDENIYVYDEYYESERTIESHANVIKAKTGRINILATYGDPSAEQEHIDYGNQKLYITPAVKIMTGGESSWVRAGIDRIQQLLKVSPRTGQPRLHVFSNCVNMIKEFESYRWIDKKEMSLQEGNEREVPMKANDHAMDALRYFVVSYFAGKPIGDSLVVK